MTSAKKLAANRKNSERSTGPKSPAGKRHSAHNAIKHGICSRELALTDRDRPEFEALRKLLRDQFAPASPMQEMAFDRMLCSCWRCKLATRLEMNRLTAHFDREEKEGSADTAAPAEHQPSKWYGAGNAELQVARRFFAYLRAEIEANGFAHHENWRDPIIKACGSLELYDSLMHWKPDVSRDDILLFDALSAKGRMYKFELPPQFQENSDTARVIIASRLKLQMAIRLVDERRQHLEDLARVNSLRGIGSGEGRGGDPVEAMTRYFAGATRELERSVKWYLELKNQGL
jgi:hypothetical protein